MGAEGTRLHKRGIASAEDGEEPHPEPQGILDAVGDSPPYLRQGSRGALAVGTPTERSGAGRARSRMEARDVQMDMNVSFCQAIANKKLGH